MRSAYLPQVLHSAASLHTPWPITLVQGWGSDDEGDARLDEELTREFHFGGGLFEKKAGGGQEGEEGGEEGEERPHKKSKKEVRRRAAVGLSSGGGGPERRAIWVLEGQDELHAVAHEDAPSGALIRRTPCSHACKDTGRWPRRARS